MQFHPILKHFVEFTAYGLGPEMGGEEETDLFLRAIHTREEEG